jgi:hypothetical protein
VTREFRVELIVNELLTISQIGVGTWRRKIVYVPRKLAVGDWGIALVDGEVVR